MTDAIETETLHGYTCELFYDPDAGNPYEEWEQASELLSDVKDYALGGDVPHPEGWSRDHPVSAVMARYLTLFGGYALAIPWRFSDYGPRAFLYDPHDDDRASGWLVMTPEAASEFETLADAERCARSEFGVFAAWLEGSVFGYVVTDTRTGETVDSCWGFYEDEKYPMQEAREMAKWANRERLINQEPIDVAEVIATA